MSTARKMQFYQANNEMEQCIQDCLDCFSICKNTLSYCIRQGGEHAELKHLSVMMDCAEICNTAAAFMLSGSTNHALTCGACADICKQCAQSCYAFNDSQMKECADMCTKCAKSCAAMAKK
jgi:hypothetical protein